MYRNWINSLGVCPTVNHLYSEMSAGVFIFHLMDTIVPGIVDWERRVVLPPNMSRIRAKRFQEQLANCNYAVELAKKMNLVVVGIAGFCNTNRDQQIKLKHILQDLIFMKAMRH